MKIPTDDYMSVQQCILMYPLLGGGAVIALWSAVYLVRNLENHFKRITMTIVSVYFSKE